MTQLVAPPPPNAFENDTPVDSALVVLDLLYREWGSKSERVLKLPYTDLGDKWPPYVEISWYCGGYTREELSRVYRFQVTAAAVGALLATSYVRPTPRWGGVNKHELMLTDIGLSAITALHALVHADAPWERQLRAEHWLERRRWR